MLSWSLNSKVVYRLGYGGYVRNLDVPYLSVTTSYVVTT